MSKRENSIRRRERRPRRAVKGSSGHDELNRSDVSSSKEDFRESCLDLVEVTGCGGGGGEGGDCGGEAEEGSVTVRKLVSFIGERFWSVWTLGK